MTSDKTFRDRPAVDWALLVIRLLAGVIFLAHGAQKLGAFGGSAYLPLWLYIASARDGHSDVSLLGHADGDAWPAPLIRFYRGELSEEGVRNAALSTDPQTARGQRCEADFYIAVWRVLQQQKDLARQLLESAAAECPHYFIEYEMLPVEMKRLDAQAVLVQKPAGP